MDFLILSIIGIIIIVYALYKVFNWLLIDKNPTLSMDQSVNKPNFFARENKKLAEKDLKDQNKFILTEVSKML